MDAADVNRLFNSATEHHRAGRLPDAERAYRQILAINPNHGQAMRLLALIATQVGKAHDAIELLSHAVRLYPSDAMMHFDLANAQTLAGDTKSAIQSLGRAIAIQHNYFEAHNNMADLYLRAGKPDFAVMSARTAIGLAPARAEPHYLLGNALVMLHQLDAAIDSFAKALAIHPNYVAALHNMAVACTDRGRADQAIDCYRRLIVLVPQSAEAHYSLGSLLLQRDDLDAAGEHLQRAIDLKPSHVEAHNNLGSSLRKRGRVDEAIAVYERGLAIDPSSNELHWNRAFALLLQGRFAEGWPAYERRLNFNIARSDIQKQRDAAAPRWHGENLDGKTLLLRSEQGFGDVIHFIRYVLKLVALGATVIVECPAPLHRLLQRMPGIHAVFAPEDAGPHFDLQCPIMSLALELGINSIDAIPQAAPYLSADPADVETWKNELADDKNIRVGLAWSGNPIQPVNRQRSIALKDLAPLASDGVTFYSLQKGDAASESLNPPAGMRWIDHTARLNDFADTAALIANLDLIIAVDTAVAHLAGAMAKTTWTLIPFAPDWRWMLNREDSPWYPTMRLFRQTVRNDWNPVIARVAAELAKLIHSA